MRGFALQQVTTDGRLLQSILRYLVAAQVKHPQRLNVLLTDKQPLYTLGVLRRKQTL